MCVKEPYECYCPCHSNPNIKHVMACCHTCPKCNKRITFEFEEHVKECNGILNRPHLLRSYIK
jgi:hypothetical protein